MSRSSVQKALQILKTVGSQHEKGMRLTDVCDALGLGKPTALRLLRELEAEELLARHPRNKRFYLGSYCRTLGQALTAQSSLSARYTPLLRRIASRTEDATFLVIQQALDTLCIAREAGTYPIQALAIPVGNRQPMGVGAGGLAMLATFEPSMTEHYLSANQARFLKYKSLTVEDLRRRIARGRKRGYVVIGSHAVARVTGVGMTLVSKEGDVLGGISVAALDNRMTNKRQEDVARIIREEMDMFLDK